MSLKSLIKEILEENFHFPFTRVFSYKFFRNIFIKQLSNFSVSVHSEGFQVFTHREIRARLLYIRFANARRYRCKHKFRRRWGANGHSFGVIVQQRVRAKALSKLKAKTKGENSYLRFAFHSADRLRPFQFQNKNSLCQMKQPGSSRSREVSHLSREGKERKREKKIGRRKSPLSRARGIGNLAQKQWIERRFVDAREAAIKRRTCRWCASRGESIGFS